MKGGTGISPEWDTHRTLDGREINAHRQRAATALREQESFSTMRGHV